MLLMRFPMLAIGQAVELIVASTNHEAYPKTFSEAVSD
jgi:hypothetical protein